MSVLPPKLIEKPPTFGEQLGKSLTKSLVPTFEKSISDTIKDYKKKKGLDEIFGKEEEEKLTPEQQEEQFRERASLYEKETGEDATPEVLDKLWEQVQLDSAMPQQRRNIAQADPQKIIKAMAGGYIDEETGKQLLEQQREQRKEDRELRKEARDDRKYAQEETKAVKEDLRKTRQNLPEINTSLELIEGALHNPKAYEGLQDYFADTFGFEGFRSKNAAELRSGVKQFVIKDLNQFTGQKNKFIMEQIVSSYPNIQRDPIANKKVLLGMQMGRDLKEEKVKIADQLEDTYMDKLGYLPANFENILNRNMRPIAKQYQEKLVKDYRNLNRIDKNIRREKRKLKKNETLVLSPEGYLGGFPSEDIEEASKEGYIIL